MTVERIRVKVCGLTTTDDVAMAVHSGVDAIGLVFYAPSPRAVTLDQAASILVGLPPFVSSVGLFVDADAETVAATLARVPLTALQFHGSEPPEFCAAFNRPYLRAVRMAPELDLLALDRQFASAQALLLDAFVQGVPGGTGESFDWSRLAGLTLRPFVLAGGLTPANVAAAIECSGAYAVDVSGGVEATKGRKDPEKLKAFMQGVARVRNCT